MRERKLMSESCCKSKSIQYITKEEVSKYWNTRNICLEFADGTDSLAQENGYTLKQCLDMTDVKYFLD